MKIALTSIFILCFASQSFAANFYCNGRKLKDLKTGDVIRTFGYSEEFMGVDGACLPTLKATHNL